MSKLPMNQKKHPAHNLPEVGGKQPSNGFPLVDDTPNAGSDFDPSNYMNQQYGNS